MERPIDKYLRPLLHTGPGYYLFVGAMVALILWAVYAYLQQLATGLWVTGMNTPAYWGIYVVNFVFFVGLSAGGVIVASLVHAFDIRRFNAVARIAELSAISCLVLATVFITLDLGRPDRLFYLLWYGRLGSPLVWDVIIITIYLLVCLAYGYFGARADLLKCMRRFPRRAWLYRLLALGYTDGSEAAIARDRKILRGLAIAALPVAVALHSITAWILGLVKAQPGWNSALLAPLFVVSATVSGMALVILSVIVGRRFLRLEIEEGVVADLGKLLLFAIPVLGYLLFAELLTVTYAKEPSALGIFREMIWGRFAGVFWANLVLGLLIPLVILWRPRVRAVAWVGGVAAVIVAVFAQRLTAVVPRFLTQAAPQVVGPTLPPWVEYTLLWLLALLLPLLLLTNPRTRTTVGVGVAAALVVLGVLAERWNIVIPTLFQRALPYAPGEYTPTWIEYSLTIGVYALGALIFAVCAKLFPLVEIEEGAEVEPAPPPAEARIPSW